MYIENEDFGRMGPINQETELEFLQWLEEAPGKYDWRCGDWIMQAMFEILAARQEYVKSTKELDNDTQ